MSLSTPVDVEVTDVDTTPLTPQDRCDRCGAQAFVRTTHDKSDLLWCAHHFRQHEPELAEAKVVDDRAKINREASVSAY